MTPAWHFPQNMPALRSGWPNHAAKATVPRRCAGADPSKPGQSVGALARSQDQPDQRVHASGVGQSEGENGLSGSLSGLVAARTRPAVFNFWAGPVSMLPPTQIRLIEQSLSNGDGGKFRVIEKQAADANMKHHLPEVLRGGGELRFKCSSIAERMDWAKLDTNGGLIIVKWSPSSQWRWGRL